MNRAGAVALGIAVVGLLAPAPAAAQRCGFSCTVGMYLELPDDAKMAFIESHARTSRRSRNPNVQACIEGLSDAQIRVVFETYVEKRPDTHVNRASGIYAMAIGACDKSKLAEMPAEAPDEMPAEPAPPEAAPVAPVEESPAEPLAPPSPADGEGEAPER